MGAGIPFGEYLLIRRLGKGGMAEVFLAKRIRAKGFEKLLVIKRLLPHLCRDDRPAAMFLNEARIAALIDHPNLAHVSDFGEVHGSYYLAMEYVQGQSLAELLETTGSMPVTVAVRIAIEILEALEAIHTAKSADGVPLGLVHRDVSPRNVMIRPDGVVKLLDLGIAVSGEGGEHPAMGTRGYMSPEQEKGGRVDARSDLFVVGLLLRRMLGSDPEDRVPAELDAILERVLAADPDKRPSSALELHDLLEAFVAPFGVEASRKNVAALVTRARTRSFGRRVATRIARITRLTRIDRSFEAGGEGGMAGGRPGARLLIMVFGAALISGVALAFAIVRTSQPPPDAAEEAEAVTVDPPPQVEVKSATSTAHAPQPEPEPEPERVAAAAASAEEPHRRANRKREAQPGFLTIDTDPWTEVHLGSKKLGITPLEAVRLPSGAHELELRNPEFGLKRRVKVVIHAGATTRLHKSFAP